MTKKKLKKPDYLFEVSWEVCNKVGGIYTVISTKYPVLKRQMGENIIMIGPDVWKGNTPNPDFIEDKELYRAWREFAVSEGLRCKVGRWNIPGEPVAILVDFTPFYQQKDEIFAEFWRAYQLDSLHGSWDYIEPAIFGYAAGAVIRSFSNFNFSGTDAIIGQFHEWMTGTGILYLKKHAPHISTLFTTHATVIGRSMAGNGQPLYRSMKKVNADQKAAEFHVISKHSLEKISALEADAFTTVSELTAGECSAFFSKEVDLVTPNGFSDDFVPQRDDFKKKREKARVQLIRTAEAVIGVSISKDAFIVATSGRYEFKNKGLDVFIDALDYINHNLQSDREILAFIMVPAAHSGPDEYVKKSLDTPEYQHKPIVSYCSHVLQGKEHDPVYQKLRNSGLKNRPEDKVKIVFIPTYLNGYDGIFNQGYFDVLIGCDLTVFASYYEPWGYTPMESLAFHIPTITTSLTGFGKWMDQKVKDKKGALQVIERDDDAYDSVVVAIAEQVAKTANLSTSAYQKVRTASHKLSRETLWDHLTGYYFEAFDIAIKNSEKRNKGKALHITRKDRTADYLNIGNLALANEPVLRKVFIEPSFPPAIERLRDLSENLWWCWQPTAIELFEYVDPIAWKASGHNPVDLLSRLSIATIARLENDKVFTQKLEKVFKQFEAYMEAKSDTKQPSVAYFCMEYGLHESIKLYSGGLGVLAGDYLKEASDQNTPMVGIGLMYRFGYFHQNLTTHGDQVAEYEVQKFTKLPIRPVKDNNGQWLKVVITLPGRPVYAKIWKLQIGRVPLYLLDTDTTENSDEDKKLTASLYGGDKEHRLKQELLLGIGGMKALEMLGLKPEVYHLNEGHAAFLGLERVRALIQEQHMSFDEALEVVKSNSLFTTHTPVPAGHDTFKEDLLRAYLANYSEMFNIDWSRMVSLGRTSPIKVEEDFSMSHLAVRLSQEVNGVSLLHGEVSRQMFQPLFRGYEANESHIGHVTNGVHLPTWISKEFRETLRQLDKDAHYDQLLKRIDEVPDEKIWAIRQSLKRALIEEVKIRLKQEMTNRGVAPARIFQAVKALDDDAMIFGFARRFATYKRATLLFTDQERLSSIVNNPERPVRFIFAGKAHPDDVEGQRFIKRIVELSLKPEFLGKVIFIQNYEMDLARLLVHGVDVWLNTPTRPLEASGTSGMKATLNGVINMSVLDGWWAEGYQENAGWALPLERAYENQDSQNQLDAEMLYGQIEFEAAPEYFLKNHEGLPGSWISRIKNAMRDVAPQFTMTRMLNEYREKYYQPLGRRGKELADNHHQKAIELSHWKMKVRAAWKNMEVAELQLTDTTNKALPLGHSFKASIHLKTPGLSPDEIGVELVFYEEQEGIRQMVHRAEFELRENNGSGAIYSVDVPTTRSGVFEYGIRVFPKHPLLSNRTDFPLVKWIGG
jgi:phosphorylase/glycogen(starch) synthase